MVCAKDKVDVLTATCTELQKLLTEGEIKSTDLVDVYLAQIEKHNHQGLKLNAMISTTPRSKALAIAEALDMERAAGKVRGPLHGIPLSVKDNICTHPSFEMDTTCGSFALVGAKPKGNALVVDRLIKAGMIVIGKANLSEFAGWKGYGITTGWSAVGGQTQSPYVVGGVVEGERLLGDSAPAGSSSGSAAGLAAGFAPLTLATETDGSITQPASRAALFGIKVTIGAVSTEGTSPTSHLTDSIGGMAKSAEDLAHLVDSLIDGKNFAQGLSKTFDGIKVGFVDDKLRSLGAFVCNPDPALIAQQRADYMMVKSKLHEAQATIHEDVPFPSMEDLDYDGEDGLEQLWDHDFAKEFAEYLKFFDDTSIQGIADIVEFNKKNAERELPPKFPGQQLLEGSLKNEMTEAKYADAFETVRRAARTNGVQKTIIDFDLDVVIGPMDGRIVTIAAAAGYPVGTVPLGYAPTNGRPYGIAVVAAAGEERKILNYMSAWDETLPKRIAPPQVVDWDQKHKPKV